VLSRLQDDPVRYRSYLARAVLLSSGLGMPVIGFLLGNTTPLIVLLFGARWQPCAPILQALSLSVFLATVSIASSWILLSLGRARRRFFWNLWTTALTVAGFFCGLPWGTAGVAGAFSVVRAVTFLPTLMYACHDTPVNWRWLLRQAALPAFATLMALAVSQAAAPLFADGLGRLFAKAVIFSLAYGLCWTVTAGGRAMLAEALAAARTLYR